MRNNKTSSNQNPCDHIILFEVAALSLCLTKRVHLPFRTPWRHFSCHVGTRLPSRHTSAFQHGSVGNRIQFRPLSCGTVHACSVRSRSTQKPHNHPCRNTIGRLHRRRAKCHTQRARRRWGFQTTVCSTLKTTEEQHRGAKAVQSYSHSCLLFGCHSFSWPAITVQCRR